VRVMGRMMMVAMLGGRLLIYFMSGAMLGVLKGILANEDWRNPLKAGNLSR
jgi:hypothetical protein